MDLCRPPDATVEAVVSQELEGQEHNLLIRPTIMQVHIPMDVLGLSWTSIPAVRFVPASSHIAKNTLYFIKF
jgi:hypothetical protein